MKKPHRRASAATRRRLKALRKKFHLGEFKSPQAATSGDKKILAQIKHLKTLRKAELSKIHGLQAALMPPMLSALPLDPFDLREA